MYKISDYEAIGLRNNTGTAIMELFPSQSRSHILAFQFSSWYPVFHTISIKSTIIRPLSQDFHNYLNADQVFVPKGSENVLVCIS